MERRCRWTGRCIVVSEEDEETSSGVVTKRTEKYMGKGKNSNTVLLVVVLVMGVALIFICFAMVAICYRSAPPTVFVIVCVSASVWVTQQFGGQIWGGLRIWSPTFGAQNQGCFQKWPKLVTPYTSVCALSENTTALSATIRLQPLSGRILLLFTTAAICTKEWTYEIVKYGRRTSCFVFSSFCIIVIVDMQQWRWRVSKCGGGCFSHSTRCSWPSRLPHNYNNNLAEPPTLPLK